jgi:hypothetical protein
MKNNTAEGLTSLAVECDEIAQQATEAGRVETRLTNGASKKPPQAKVPRGWSRIAADDDPNLF